MNSISKRMLSVGFASVLVACSGSNDTQSQPNGSTDDVPIVDAGTDFQADEMTSVTLLGQGTSESGIREYRWRQIAGESVSLTQTESFSAVFQAPVTTEQLTLSFQLAVTNENGASATDIVDVTIIPVNALPEANAGNNRQVYEEIRVNLQGSGTDNDGNIAAYQWRQLSGVEVEISAANAAHAEFTSPPVQDEKTLTFELSVTDNEGGVSTDIVEIGVVPVTLEPIQYTAEFDDHIYLDFPSAIQRLDNDGTVIGPNDENNVTLLNNGQLIDIYHPTFIAARCIGYFGGYVQTEEQVYSDIVISHADWLVDNQQTTAQGFGVWTLDFSNEIFGAQSPWLSAMTQGRAISCLLRANQIQHNPKYLAAAKSALAAFDYGIDEGGVTYRDSAGNAWYEEVAVLPPAHILNGFIFAMFGLYDYYRVTEEAHALALFNAGVDTLLKNLDLYDTGGVSRYDLLLRGQLFQIRAPGVQPQQIHPIDKLSLTVNNIHSELDVGAEADNLVRPTKSYVWYDDDENLMDWSHAYALDNRTVRNYEANPSAKSRRAAYLQIELPQDLTWAVEGLPVKVTVDYKDTASEPITLHVYDGEIYHLVGTIAGAQSNEWRTAEFVFDSDLLRFGGRLSESYHDIVVAQLKGLFNITGNNQFLATSELWAEQFTSP